MENKWLCSFLNLQKPVSAYTNRMRKICAKIYCDTNLSWCHFFHLYSMQRFPAQGAGGRSDSDRQYFAELMEQGSHLIMNLQLLQVAI